MYSIAFTSSCYPTEIVGLQHNCNVVPTAQRGHQSTPSFIKNKSFETNYLSIYRTDFHQIFIICMYLIVD